MDSADHPNVERADPFKEKHLTSCGNHQFQTCTFEEEIPETPRKVLERLNKQKYEEKTTESQIQPKRLNKSGNSQDLSRSSEKDYISAPKRSKMIPGTHLPKMDTPVRSSTITCFPPHHLTSRLK